MEWWHAVILGLVEGVTEYLPVSSTGHLILTSQLLGLKSASHREAIAAFEIVIQGGAILAVLGLYWSRFVQMVMGLLGRDGNGFALLVNLGIAFTPAALLGLLLKSRIETYLFSAWPVVFALIVGGVYMILFDARLRGRWGPPPMGVGAGKGIDDLTPRDALVIGIMQIVSLWPGTSRSMMTITGGMLVGLRPAAAAEFSFLLGMPTLLAATLWTGYKNIAESRAKGEPTFYEQLGMFPVLIGMAVAFISAWIAVKWLVGFLNRHGLAPFGVYRIIIGLVIAGLIVGQVVVIAK
ncbi:MAG: undecaprenyl-diphosphate phosphatase [Phycisphaerales bacterium]|nr:undecaprenyl-diphosphate phosphatase [Phycisphaerales bacterium]